MTRATDLPLVIDLDGTLVLDDTLEVMGRRLMSERPLAAGIAVAHGLRGRSRLKHYLWEQCPVGPDDLRWNVPLLERLRQEEEAGRTIILATGAPEPLATTVVAHLPGIADVLASSRGLNLTSHRKAAALVHRFGWRGFVYAGNSRADLPVWGAAGGAWVCNAPPQLAREAARRTRVLEVL